MNDQVERWARHPLAVDADQVFAALEKIATVALIATSAKDLRTCAADEPVSETVNRGELSDFHYIPVRQQDGAIIGLFHRAAEEIRLMGSAVTTQYSVHERMEPLSAKNLISADAGILSFISRADTHPCRLLVKDTDICGLVTTADLNALPVRPVLFLILTHVELLMAELIRTRLTAPQAWLTLLSKGRQAKVHEKFARLQKSNMFTEILAATDHCDKRAILIKGKLVPKNLARSANEDLKRIEQLRNSVAHADGYADTPDQAANLSRTVRVCQAWIEALQADFKTDRSVA
jgi:predicted transcriptional regulator